MEDIEMKDETNSLKENEDLEQNKNIEEKSNQDLKSEYKWPHQKKNKYSIEEKLSIINEAKINSLHSIDKKIWNSSQIYQRLGNQEEELKAQISYKKYRLSGGGCRSQISKENETKIVNWIIQTRKQNYQLQLKL